MHRILITTSSFDSQNIHPAISSHLKNNHIELVFNPHKRRLKKEEIIELLDGTVIGMVAGLEPLSRDVLQNARSLKVISRCGIGLDNVDLKAAHELGIHVYNTPTAPVEAVAELTLGFILCLLRKIVINDRHMRIKNWQPFMGNLLSAQTVGIIGYGRIGRRVAHLIAAFGANILIHDPYYSEAVVVGKMCDLTELLKKSNIITLHIPGTNENFHFIDQKKLNLMKPGSILVNTSRGDLIDETSLYQALESGHLAGAALDVFEQEPYQGPLLSLQNALLTSHIGSHAIEARKEMETEAMQNLISGLQLNGILSAIKM